MIRFVVVVMCSLVLIGGRTARSADLKGSRPNIILVMTDDQGKGELSCLGNTYLPTPHLDRLHSQSLRFTDFHVSPTCSPTRSAIMSGRHEFQNGVTHTILERERMALGTQTLPSALQQAGYQTGIFGKWHLGDEEEYQPNHRGFGEAFIHGAGGIGQAYECSCADYPPNQSNKYFDCVLRHNDTLVQTKGFCTDVFFQAALGWIKKQHDNQQPFFAYIVTNAPHGPMIAPQSSKQPFLDAGYDEETAARFGMITNIDDNMGVLMSKLTQWNMDENTLLIFMTDNGQSQRQGKLNGKKIALFSGNLREGKGSPHEGGTRVPAFWRWTGRLPAGVDTDALTAHIDLFPTFCDLTNAQLPENHQVTGRSMLPLLANPDASWADRYLFTHKGRWEKGSNPHDAKYNGCAVRNERYRMVNNSMLFDIQADPQEKNNLFDQLPDVVQEMQHAYDQWWMQSVPLMVNENVPNSPIRPNWVLYEKQSRQQGIPEWKPDPL